MNENDMASGYMEEKDKYFMISKKNTRAVIALIVALLTGNTGMNAYNRYSISAAPLPGSPTSVTMATNKNTNDIVEIKKNVKEVKKDHKSETKELRLAIEALSKTAQANASSCRDLKTQHEGFVKRFEDNMRYQQTQNVNIMNAINRRNGH